MRNLQPSQFDQPLPGMDYETGRYGTPGRFARAASDRSKGYDPGPSGLRGDVSEGQRRWNFNPRQLAMDSREQREFMESDFALEHGPGGLIPVDESSDPDYSLGMWSYGGAFRRPDTDRGRKVSAAWENQPVEKIGPETEIRTGQVHYPEGRSDQPRVEHQPDYVRELRHAQEFRDIASDAPVSDPRAGGKVQRPWIARVQSEEGPKNYLLEGHHRAIASRTRGTGEFEAHVVEASDWQEFPGKLNRGLR